ncbi:hypothetical protein FSARC_9176 [Fusarium sarcochroum]|uniref:FAD-binding PCMH-type domain-containing protein n=1 Tax=Fusarium sarcochroum TaxID=1208366 RepID=A0A8H4TRT5_9HYPO|nr:hypothetical protein FSARC_9176 [Fusarium sarcochroum]
MRRSTLGFAFLWSVGIAASTGSSEACSQLASSFTSQDVLFPNSSHYDAERKNFWDQRSAAFPACIVFPNSANQVAEAIEILHSTKAEFAIRGGGHMNFPGSNNIDGGVLLALNKLNSIQVHTNSYQSIPSVSVDAGSKWNEVYDALSPYGLYTIGGRLKTIGVPGLTLIGGLHYFTNKYGWTADNVLEYHVVLGNGTQVVANRTTHADLYWALKGGANNFGIVTRFVFQAYKIPTLSTTTMKFDNASIDKFIETISQYTIHNDGALGSGPVTTMSCNTTTKEINVEFIGVQEGGESPPSRFSAFTAIPPTEIFNNVTTPKDWHNKFDTPNGLSRILFGHHTIHAEAVDRLKEIIHAWVDATSEIEDIEGLASGFVLNTFPASAARPAQVNGVGNIFGVEEQPMILWQLTTAWKNQVDDLQVTSWARRFLDYQHTINQEKGLSTDLIYAGDAAEWQNPFSVLPSHNLQRLKTVRAVYDPDLVFTRQNWGGFKLGS